MIRGVYFVACLTVSGRGVEQVLTDGVINPIVTQLQRDPICADGHGSCPIVFEIQYS